MLKRPRVRDTRTGKSAEAGRIMPTAKRKQALAPVEAIPEKIYFRIGEVSELAKLPTYVLRFWETEFPQLKPSKSSTGQRMYRRRDVEFVMQIRKLLYEDGFTIAGARERLREEARLARLAEPIRVQPPTPAEAADGHAAAETALATGSQKAEPAAQSFEGDQATLFPIVQDPGKAQRTKKLQRVRRQLSEVLDLLS
jgi:DNA-binding transcriptional MerR regulator